MGRIVKSLNFLSDEYNESTEIITLTKHAKALTAANEALLKATEKAVKRRNILSTHLTDCNPYEPVLDENMDMTPQHRNSRTLHHMRKLTN